MPLNCKNPDDVLKAITDNDVRMVDVRFADLPGAWQHFSVPPHCIDADVFDEGIGFDGSSIRGFQQIQESDMMVVPNAETAFLDPFTAVPTLVMICNVRDPVTGQPYSRDPRYIAQKAEAHLKSTGVADVAYFGPEAEFFVFNDVRYGQGTNYGFYTVDSTEGNWATGKEEDPNLGHKPRPKEGYFPCPPTDSMQDIRTEMVLTMEEIGIPVECHHHEVATGGQAEIAMRFAALTRMADSLMKYKYVVKNVAHTYGMTATFMPKPLFEDNWSGMHVHSHLGTRDPNLFFSASDYAGLCDWAATMSAGCSSTRRRCSPSARRPPTPITAWFPASRRRSTWCIRSATGRRAAASPCTRPTRRRSASSSARRTRLATATSPLPPCSWRGSTASKTRSTPARPSTRTFTTCRPRRRRR